MNDKPKTLRERRDAYAELLGNPTYEQWIDHGDKALGLLDEALDQLDEMATRRERVDAFLENVHVVLVDGVEGEALYINNYRIAGPKPWGGGEVLKEWKGSLTRALTRYEGREK